ncbi:uncharacterized protein LOC131429241 [Malaya genurostris]|uniref:uncharacterized protein LOC131429241 n=1 Tax=Malaya genurostris TaxID=325434 RepID=UPI0026F38FFD|nr:uncharacterized protein LOC131429241 [Malaya genurostris]
MGKVVLYTAKLSPPGRSVELTAKALGLELEINPVNLLAGDHLKPEFVKMNPQHTIPLIIDEDGTVVYDSHAINIYLATKYGKDDSLYPNDIATRAKINAALHFDSGVLFARLRFYLEPILYYGSVETPQDRIDYLYKAYELLNDTLVNDYIVGNKLTLADLSCIASIASVHAIFPIDKSKYPKLAAWVERVSTLPYYKKTNQEGAEELASLYRAKLEENRQKAKKLAIMNPVLYYDDASPPVRSVLLTISALDINDKIDMKWINLFGADHLKPDFVNINPLHTVPVLTDEELILTDSHAILTYLCDVYGQGTNFSLGDPKQRAIVLNRLCFNNSVLFQRDAELMRKIFRKQLRDISTHLKPVEEAIDYLEIYLKTSKFVACDKLTVADFSIVATLSTAESVCPISSSRWPKVKAWYEEMQKLPYYNDANQVGLTKLRAKLNSILNA